MLTWAVVKKPTTADSTPAGAESQVEVCTLARCSRSVSVQKSARMVDRLRFEFGRVLPRVNRGFCVWGQRQDVFTHPVRMRWDIVRHNQHRRATVAYEVPRHAVHEVQFRSVQ